MTEGVEQDQIASVVRAARQAAGYTQEQLAAAAGISARTVAYIEAGRIRRPRRATIGAIAAVLDNGSEVSERIVELLRDDTGRAGRQHAIPRQLPTIPTHWVGRGEEIAAAELAAARGGVLIASGMPGVGKTAFALYLANRLVRRFPDGQLFVDLGGFDVRPRAPGEVQASVLRSLCGADVRLPAEPGELAALYRSAVAVRKCLIVLDNARDEAHVRHLIPGDCPSLFLITSRRSLASLDCSRRFVLTAFDPDQSYDLLARAAGDTLLAAELSPTAELIEQCGGLPLALRIAAARLVGGASGAVAHLADRLRSERSRLDRMTAGDLDVRGVFAVSYQSLDATARRVFRGAGLFPGAEFTAEAAAALTGLPFEQTEDALERVVEASLLQQAAHRRYGIHDLLRVFAIELAGAEDEQEDQSRAIRRLTYWYLDQAVSADRLLLPGRVRLGIPPPDAGPVCRPIQTRAEASRWFDDEIANLLPVMDAAAGSGHHDLAWRLPVALRGLFELRSHWQEWIASHQAGLQAAQACGDLQGQAWLHNGLGIARWRLERNDDAIESYRSALDICTRLGDRRGTGAVLNNLGTLYGAIGRRAEATDYLRQALAEGRETGTDLAISFALHNLGHIYHVSGQYAEAMSALQEALRMRREQGSRNGEAITLHCLGDTLHGLGRDREAVTHLRRALAIFRELRNRYGEAAVKLSLGRVCVSLDRRPMAAALLTDAARRFRQLGMRAEESEAERDLAGLAADPPVR